VQTISMSIVARGYHCSRRYAKRRKQSTNIPVACVATPYVEQRKDGMLCCRDALFFTL